MPTSGDKPRIVFFGSGSVAAQSLELLTKSFSIEAVVTKPKPSHHRGDFPAVTVAEKHDLPIIYVRDKKETSEKIVTRQFESKVGVLIDFGIIVAQDVIDTFPLGIINSHFSLLPELRGADPITFAILSGQVRTGVSLMRLVPAMDEGDILAFGVQELGSDVTTPQLTEQLIRLSYSLLEHEIPRYLDGAQLFDQSEINTMVSDFAYPTVPTYTRKLTKADGVLDLSKSAAQLEREIRAYAGWPGSRTTIADRDVVITAAHVSTGDINVNDVDVTAFVANKRLYLRAKDDLLVVDRLKPAGKPEMSASAFLAGHSQKLPTLGF